MSSFNLSGAGLILALVIPGAAGAQGAARAAIQPAMGVASGAAPLLAPDVIARLTPRKWMYVTTLVAGGTPQRIGFRTLSLSDVVYQGTPAWLAINEQQLETSTYAESLYVSKADLSPLYRVAHTHSGQIVSRYAADSIRTTFDDDSGHTAVAMRNEPGVLSGIYMIEELIGASQLGEQWMTSARLAAIDRHQSGVVNVDTRVVGEQQVPIPDGVFDAWVVSMKIGSGQETLWVRKSDGVVIKEEVPAVGMNGATVQMVLGLNGVE